MFDTTDPRAGLPSSGSGTMAPPSVGFVQSFQLADIEPDDAGAGAPQQWSVRGATFVVTYAVADRDTTEVWPDIGDETVLVVTDPAASLTISSPGQDLEIDEPSVVILPAGEYRVTARTTGTYVRVVPDRSVAGVPTARNSAFYAQPHAGIDPLPPRAPDHQGVVRVHRLADVHPVPGRFGRIFQSSSLMVNILEAESGPRDPDKLSPHLHETFEQCSVTLHGDYVHHLRVPWTPRQSEWRDDEHLPCSSPSITVIPPGMIHTTRSVGPGHHLMMDVFAPPRTDFLAMDGWVLNAADYPAETAS